MAALEESPAAKERQEILECKANVGVFSRYFPTYRDAVFTLLAHNSKLDFEFLAGLPPVDSCIKESQQKPYRFSRIKVVCIPVPGTPNCLSYRSGTIMAMLRHRYDVLILPNDILGIDIWICCCLARILRIPVCIWGQGMSRPTSRLRDGLRFALTSLATAGVYYSEGGRNYWAHKGIRPEKLFVAYNALDTEKQISLRDRLTEADLVSKLQTLGLFGRIPVIFVGRLIGEKKPIVFIKAVEKAAAVEPKLIGLVIGEGPEKKALEQYVAQRKLTSTVRFLGAVYEEEELAKLMMASVAIIHPALAGLAIEHAAVYGTPLILGDLPGRHLPEQEIVVEGKTGIWCPDEDIDAFAGAILRLSHDQSLRKAFATNLRDTITTKYNVRRMAQGFIDSVNYCLGRRGAKGNC